MHYGYDSDGDGIVNQYLTANAIKPYSDLWTDILSVKIELLTRSLKPVAVSPQSYFFAGSKITPDDNYIRRVLIATVKLRNRGQ